MCADEVHCPCHVGLSPYELTRCRSGFQEHSHHPCAGHSMSRLGCSVKAASQQTRARWLLQCQGHHRGDNIVERTNDFSQVQSKQLMGPMAFRVLQIHL